MKKIVLISSYCDTEEKINILKKNLIIYKELGLDTLLISSLKLSEDVINLCDFYFYTKENPVLCWPERAYTHWVKIETDTNEKLTLHRGHCDYGWAALYQTKILLELGLMLKYDILIHTIYDILIDDRTKYVDKFVSAGGSAILYKDANQAASDLQKLYDELMSGN